MNIIQMLPNLTVLQFGFACIGIGILVMAGLVLLFTLPAIRSEEDLESARAIKERWRSNLPAVIRNRINDGTE
jgi:hypothetical protein